MFGLGMSELLIIFVIILITFGAGKLPQLGSGIGKGIKNFQRAIKGADEPQVIPRPPSASSPWPSLHSTAIP